MPTAADALLHALLEAPSVLLTGPVGPDGDSLGASLALGRVLRARGVQVDVTGDVGRRYAFLPGADTLWSDAEVGARASKSPWHTVVVLDGDRHRLLPGAEQAWAAAARRAVVDHHVSTTADGYDLVWVDADATSTCMMVLDALDAWGVPLDPELATLLHTGNVFDTGGFRFENATPEVFRAAARCIAEGADHVAICTQVLQQRRWRGVAALGRVLSAAVRVADGRGAVARVPLDLQKDLDLTRDDLEGIVDNLLFVEGVEVAALLIAMPDHTKVSLRSRGRVDVAALAARLAPSGGGHRKAAGARSHLPTDAIVQAVEQSLR